MRVLNQPTLQTLEELVQYYLRLGLTDSEQMTMSQIKVEATRRMQVRLAMSDITNILKP